MRSRVISIFPMRSRSSMSSRLCESSEISPKPSMPARPLREWISRKILLTSSGRTSLPCDSNSTRSRERVSRSSSASPVNSSRARSSSLAIPRENYRDVARTACHRLFVPREGDGRAHGAPRQSALRGVEADEGAARAGRARPSDAARSHDRLALHVAADQLARGQTGDGADAQRRRAGRSGRRPHAEVDGDAEHPLPARGMPDREGDTEEGGVDRGAVRQRRAGGDSGAEALRPAGTEAPHDAHCRSRDAFRLSLLKCGAPLLLGSLLAALLGTIEARGGLALFIVVALTLAPAAGRDSSRRYSRGWG